MAILIEILIIALLIAANGFFSLSETAVIVAGRARLESLSRRGNSRASAALDLAKDPTDFLSTVQTGITLLGIIAGAYSGATLALELGRALEGIPALAAEAHGLAFVIVIAGVTYFSLIFGELIPKRLALSDPERVALAVARLMGILSRIAKPLVRFLSMSTEVFGNILGIHRRSEIPVTEEEIRMLIDVGGRTGVLDAGERLLLENVFLLGERTLQQVMVPRMLIRWVDIATPAGEAAREIAAAGFARVPVCEGNLDNVVGYVRARDVLGDVVEQRPVNLKQNLRQPLFIPESMTAFQALEAFRRNRCHIAIIVDEHGGTSGLVTLNHIAESIVAEMPGVDSAEEPGAAKRPDGTWVVDGRMPLHRVRALLPLGGPLLKTHTPYLTIGGLVMDLLGRMPREGDVVAAGPLTIEVVAMDGTRVDKLLLSAAKGVPPNQR